jgi:hypothetical protein
MGTRDREPELSGAPAPEAAPRSNRPGSEPRPSNAKQKDSFEGDVAIKELRERMALAPDLPPAPQMRDDGGSVFGTVGRLGIAAIAAGGFVWISTPLHPVDDGFALAGYDKPAAGEQPSTATFRPAVLQSPPVPAVGVEPDTLRPRNESTPVDRPPAPANPASLRRLPPSEAEIQTAPPASSAPRIDLGEIATLLVRGRNYLANGDVAAARLVFRRAAESGDAQAALALGGTFDPLVLMSLGSIGVAADPAQARSWYQKAADLGSRDAPQRLNQLAQSVR